MKEAGLAQQLRRNHLRGAAVERTAAEALRAAGVDLANVTPQACPSPIVRAVAAIAAAQDARANADPSVRGWKDRERPRFCGIF